MSIITFVTPSVAAFGGISRFIQGWQHVRWNTIRILLRPIEEILYGRSELASIEYSLIDAKLVHPIFWLGRFAVPLHVPVKHKVHVPGQHAAAGKSYDLAQGITETLVGVPEMDNARVGHVRPRHRRRLTIVFFQDGRPHDVDPQPLIIDFRQDLLLHHTGAVLARSSRGRQDEYEADATGISIKCFLEFTFALGQRDESVSAVAGRDLCEHFVKCPSECLRPLKVAIST